MTTVAGIIGEDLLRKAEVGTSRWVFRNAVSDLPDEEVATLATLFVECLVQVGQTDVTSDQIQAIRVGREISVIRSTRVGPEDLAKFVHALTICENHLDTVALLPRAQREAGLQRLADSVGWPVPFLTQAKRWWTWSGRSRVFEEAHLD